MVYGRCKNGQYMCIVQFFCLRLYCLGWDHCFCFILCEVTVDRFTPHMSLEDGEGQEGDETRCRGCKYPRPPCVLLSSNQECFAHYKHISYFFNKCSLLFLYVYTRGILGCLLEFWPRYGCNKKMKNNRKAVCLNPRNRKAKNKRQLI